MWKEFKEFAVRGNVIEMAIGVIIGTAFGKVISSLVSDVFMPPIGFLVGRVDFSYLAITLHEKTATSPRVVISYGAFINTIINFFIIAFSMFFVIRQMQRIVPKHITKKDCPFCYTNIAVQASRCPTCTSILDSQDNALKQKLIKDYRGVL